MLIAAGQPLIDVITLAVHADTPVLLIGGHGVGKSELMAQAAAQLEIGYVARDLSLMEPPDLAGLPYRDPAGRTRFAPPPFLPTDGRGLLMLEELNRCPRYVRTPCLQLLTTRTLNDYALPSGWLPCAAINPAADDDSVDDLEGPLLSRFMKVRVVASVTEWAKWATTVGGVHPQVVSFVVDSSDIFKHAQANPRAWAYVSKALSAWEKMSASQDTLAAALEGLVGQDWAAAFLQVYFGGTKPLAAKQVVAAYVSCRSLVLGWVRDGARLDLVASTFELLKRHLQSQKNYEAVLKTPAHQNNVAIFLGDLPGDLRSQANAWLNERRFVGLLGGQP